MKTIHDWFSEYGESHQNRTNKIIHWICIPLIFWSIIALLSIIPHATFFKLPLLNELSHWGTLVIFFGLLFYLRLSFKIFLGMLLVSIYILIDIYFTVLWLGEDFLMYSAISMFIIAWILQFIGHKIEGKKPSFLKDIQFLLIGPAWLLGFIYRKMGIKY